MSSSTLAYVRPTDLDQALSYLNEPDHASRPLAGGTDLLLSLRENPGFCRRVVDISLLPELRGVRRAGDDIVIGAAATFAEVLESDLVGATAPVLVEACRQVGAVQIRNMGTLGGNVVNAAACADSLPALICLDATATLRTPQGWLETPVADLVIGPNRTQMPPGALLVSLRYAIPPPGSRSLFLKLGRRNAMAISRLTVAALGHSDAAGRIAEVRLVPGSATPQIRRLSAVEEALVGRVPDEALYREAGAAAATEVLRITGMRWSSPFKQPALSAMITEALRRVFAPVKPETTLIRHYKGVDARLALDVAPASVKMNGPGEITFTLNGQAVSTVAAPGISLLQLLRDVLDLTGTKEGCAVGECGACSVLLDGRLVNACLVLAPQVSGRAVVTIEGIRGPGDGPNDLQEAFIHDGAVQCGFCTPGMVLAGEALLAQNQDPTRQEIREAIAGNLCRCTGYQQIVDAIEHTAARRRSQHD
jgi:carbon-monoxide dehydrogenase medium subunit